MTDNFTTVNRMTLSSSHRTHVITIRRVIQHARDNLQPLYKTEIVIQIISTQTNVNHITQNCRADIKYTTWTFEITVCNSILLLYLKKCPENKQDASVEHYLLCNHCSSAAGAARSSTS